MSIGSRAGVASVTLVPDGGVHIYHKIVFSLEKECKRTVCGKQSFALEPLRKRNIW